MSCRDERKEKKATREPQRRGQTGVGERGRAFERRRLPPCGQTWGGPSRQLRPRVLDCGTQLAVWLTAQHSTETGTAAAPKQLRACRFPRGAKGKAIGWRQGCALLTRRLMCCTAMCWFRKSTVSRFSGRLRGSAAAGAHKGVVATTVKREDRQIQVVSQNVKCMRGREEQQWNARSH